MTSPRFPFFILSEVRAVFWLFFTLCYTIDTNKYLAIAGVMKNVLSLYPGQPWDTSILPVLSSYGEPFMDTVCRDSCDGHDVGRVSHDAQIAFSSLKLGGS